MPISKENLESRFNEKRQELEGIERQLQELDQQGGQLRLQHQQVMGQLQTLQELYTELESQDLQAQATGIGKNLDNDIEYDPNTEPSS